MDQQGGKAPPLNNFGRLNLLKYYKKSYCGVMVRYVHVIMLPAIFVWSWVRFLFKTSLFSFCLDLNHLTSVPPITLEFKLKLKDSQVDLKIVCPGCHTCIYYNPYLK